MIAILRVFLRSWQSVWQNKKMILVLWSISLALALPLFRAIHNSLSDYFEFGNVPLEWQSLFNSGYLMEWHLDSRGMSVVITSLLFGLTLVYVVLNVFTAGGVLGTLAERETPGRFLAGFARMGGRFWGRFMRIGLITGSACLLSFFFLLLGFPGQIFTVVLCLYAIVVSDLTKVQVVETDASGCLRLYVKTALWAGRRILPIVLLYAMNLFILVAGYLLYAMFDRAFVADSVLKLCMMILIHQGFVIFRQSVRIQIYAAALFFTRGTVPAEALQSNQERA